MKTRIILAIFLNIMYFVTWYFIHKWRNSGGSTVREWDNSNEFYESLHACDKESYWKEDTKIVDYFFLVFLFFFECMLLQLVFAKALWFLTLLFGLVIAPFLCIMKSIKLQRKYKRRINR